MNQRNSARTIRDYLLAGSYKFMNEGLICCIFGNVTDPQCFNL